MEPLIPAGALRFGDMMAATFRYLRRWPGATLGIGALLATATTIISTMASSALSSAGGGALDGLAAGETLTAQQAEEAVQALMAALPYLAMALAVSALAQLAGMGVMTVGMVRALRGEPLEPGVLWRLVPWARVFAINGLVLASIVAVMGAATVVGVAVGGPAIAAILILAIGVALWIALLSTLAVPAAILEDLTVTAALRRCLTVSQGRRGRTIGLLLGATVLWTGLGEFVGLPAGSLVGALAGGNGTTTGSVLTDLVHGIAAGAVTLPAASAMAVLVYVDLVRRQLSEQPPQ